MWNFANPIQGKVMGFYIKDKSEFYILDEITIVKGMPRNLKPGSSRTFLTLIANYEQQEVAF